GAGAAVEPVGGRAALFFEAVDEVLSVAAGQAIAARIARHPVVAAVAIEPAIPGTRHQDVGAATPVPPIVTWPPLELIVPAGTAPPGGVCLRSVSSPSPRFASAAPVNRQRAPRTPR